MDTEVEGHLSGEHDNHEVNMNTDVEGISCEHDNQSAGAFVADSYSNGGESEGIDVDYDFKIQNVQRILCIGAGRTGVFSTLVLASHWPEKEFVIVDTNVDLIQKWHNNVPAELPFHEPGLDALLFAQIGVNVFFETNIQAHIQDANVIFVAVDIPTKKKGEGARGRLELKNWESAYRSIARYSTFAKYIIEKSTLPVGSARKLLEILQENGNGCRFDVVSNPEFFSQGTAIEDLQNPSRVVIAVKTNGNTNLLKSLYMRWVPEERIIEFNQPLSVELGKVASNAFWASEVGFMNVISTLCEKVGADINDIKRIIGSDRRVNDHFLDAGIGFGGAGFNKDVAYLAYLADSCGLDLEAKMFKLTIELNKKKKERFVEAMRTKMVSLEGKTIGVFGFSYKVGTDDIRDSPAIYLCERLLKCEGTQVRVFDPVVREDKIRSCFARCAKLTVVNSEERAWLNADALCFLVKWDQFRERLTNESPNIYAAMKKPAFIFDCCHFDLPFNNLSGLGFRLHVVGRPGLHV